MVTIQSVRKENEAFGQRESARGGDIPAQPKKKGKRTVLAKSSLPGGGEGKSEARNRKSRGRVGRVEIIGELSRGARTFYQREKSTVWGEGILAEEAAIEQKGDREY